MTSEASSNVTWHRGRVSRAEREVVLGQRGQLVWFTGLSGSGKSTLAVRLEEALLERERPVYRLDGDNVRHGLCADLGFSADDRRENIRRIREVAWLMADAGLIVLAAFISPYEADRQAIRERFDADRFTEVYVDTPLEVCEQRDPKGLYAKARRGEIKNFTGISAPYEAPASPEIRVDTTAETPDDAVARILERILSPS